MQEFALLYKTAILIAQMNLPFQYVLALLPAFACAAFSQSSGRDLVVKSNESESRPIFQPRQLEKGSLKERLLPAIKNGGFKMEEYILWCPSVVKVGDTYHMFASRWPAQYGLGGWTSHSECVRATSTNLCGPYAFQQVVLQKRPDHWDNSRVHNGKIIKAGSNYVLYYINSANQTGYAGADSVLGPWTRSDKVAMRVSNPAPLVRPDGTIYCLGRLRDSAGVNRGIAFTAPGFEGPYS